MIDFLILGAGGAVPTATHGPAAYWVEVDGHGILLDPGPGALVRLVRSPHGPDTVDRIATVLLSHLHLDHCADLAPLLFALHSPLLASREPLCLLGPRGLAAYLQRLRDLYGSWVEPHQRALVVHELAPSDRFDPAAPALPPSRGAASDRPPAAAVTTFAVAHSEDRFSRDCLGFRFADAAGHRVVFSGDTEPCPALVEAGRGADLLVVECSTPDAWATAGHMTPTRVAEVCRQAEPKQVVLTHQYPPAAALDLPGLVRAGYRGAVIAAADGTHLRIGAEDAPAAGAAPIPRDSKDTHETH